MYRWCGLSLGTLLLAGGLLSGVPEVSMERPALQCTLTGQKIETCCCQVRDGKLYCPLAQQAISSCCCKVIER